MRRLYVLIALSILTINTIYAQETEKSFDLTCPTNQIPWIADKRYVFVSSSDLNPIVLQDLQTIKIDKKNNIIYTTVILLSSLASTQDNSRERSEMMRKVIRNVGGDVDVKALKEALDSMHPYRPAIQNFGYRKQLIAIDYKNKQFSLLDSADFACDGYVITSKTAQLNPNMMAPNNAFVESLMNTTMQRYKLK